VIGEAPNNAVQKENLYRLSAVLLGLGLPISMLAAASPGASASMAIPQHSTVTSSSLGNFSPTFTGTAATGTAATGCASGCNLLTGPFVSPSTASFAVGSAKAKAAAKAARADIAARNAAAARLANPSALAHTMPSPMVSKNGPDPAPPSVSCDPPGSGCDRIGLGADGAKGVKGLNAVDSGTLSTNPNGDIEPADQGLCAGNGYVVEDNNDPDLQHPAQPDLLGHPARHRYGADS
jgi:hypothetical protein